VYRLARALQFAALLITGIAFFDGVLGGNVRRELALLALGGVTFLFGRWLQTRS